MVRLVDLRKRFGSIQAVDGLCLEIRAGEVFGLLGPNGAGKSTTIAMAVGLLSPDSGGVRIGEGGSPADPEVRRAIGVAPQSLALYDELSGRENLEFFASLHGLRGRRRREGVDRELSRVGLSDRARDRVGGYSGGMKRRLNLAAAIVHEPRLVFLDEPTAGVDPQSRGTILSLVREMAGAGTTIVYTTHYMEEAARLCDRVGIVDHGRLLALGGVEELVAAHGGKSVVSVEADEGVRRVETSDPAGEVARLLAGGRGVRGIRIDRPDLEAVFLSLTGRSLRD